MVKNSNGKNAFNKKQELLKNFLSNNLKKITVKVFVWSVLLYASEKCCLTTEDILRLEAMEMWIWRRIEKINRTDRLSNEEMLQRVGEKRQLINHLRERQAKWIGHVMRGDTLLRYSLRKNKRKEATRKTKV